MNIFRNRMGRLLAAAMLPASIWSATIDGTVIGAASTAAIADATVVLTRAGTGGGARTPVDTVQTDAQGGFSFPDLAAAQNYGVTVSFAGYRTYTNNNVDLESDTSMVTLAISLAVIPPPAGISGTVVGADSVTAVADATVILSRPGGGGEGGGGGFRVPVDTMQTDAQGKFDFPELEAMDNYGLTVTAAGFQTYTNNNIDLEGVDTALTIRLSPPPAPGTITGTVLGTDSSTAVANATVILSRPGGGGGGGGARIPVDTMQTDAQGQFTFAGVSAAQNYGLAVIAAGFSLYTDNNVDVAGGATVTVAIRLSPPGAPGSIAGTVRTGRDSSATAVADATVILRTPLAAGSVPLDTVRTDAEGRFSFNGIPSLDNYVVAVTAEGFFSSTNSNVDVDSGDTVTVNFTLNRPASVMRSASGQRIQLFWMGGALSMKFPARPEAHILTVYGMNGARKFRSVIPANADAIRLPGSALREKGLYLVLTSGGHREVVSLPPR